MESWARGMAVLVLLLGVLLGSVGVAFGGVEALSCTSGSQLGLTLLGQNETSPGTAETVRYDELSPEVQKVFIDAHAALQDSETNRGYSRVYTDQLSGSSLSGTEIIYKDDRYYATLIVVDCGPALTGIPLVGGVILLLIGGVPLAVEYMGQL